MGLDHRMGLHHANGLAADSRESAKDARMDLELNTNIWMLERSYFAFYCTAGVSLVKYKSLNFRISYFGVGAQNSEPQGLKLWSMHYV